MHTGSISKLNDYVAWVRFNNNSYVNLEQAIEMRDKGLELFQGEKYFGLIDTREVFTNASNEALQFLANDDKLSKFCVAQAIVVDNLAVSMVANFYTKYIKNNKEVKTFNDIDKAMKWLETKKTLLN